MRGPHNIWRLIRTGATLERTGAMGVVLEAFEAPKPLRILARTLVWPFRWIGIKGDPNMPPVVRALTALGPAYIKFGQVLSTRPDVVGSEMATQLRVLQDRLPPFSVAEAKAAIESELGVAPERQTNSLRGLGEESDFFCYVTRVQTLYDTFNTFMQKLSC